MRPGRFGIHEIGRKWGDTAPIINPGAENLPENAGAQVRRRLNIHAGPEQNSRHRNGPEQLIEIRFGSIRHLGIWLGTEILNNNFLQMSVRKVQIAQCEQRFHALATRFADADQNSRRQGNARLASLFNCRQAKRRILIGRTIMRHAFFGQSRRRRLQHYPHGRSNRAQHGYLFRRHSARIQMR